MAKIEIKFIKDNGEVKPKDELLKEILSDYFDELQEVSECEEVADAAYRFGYHQMAVDMMKQIAKMPGYKVIAAYRKAEDEGQRLFEMASDNG